MSKTILIGDKDDGLAELAAALRQAGYETISVTAGDDPVARFAVATPELVFLDLREPTAVRICEGIRDIPDGAIVPIIFVGSGAENVRSPSDALTQGGDYYFALPLDLPKVLAKVQTYVGVGTTPLPAKPPPPATAVIPAPGMVPVPTRLPTPLDDDETPIEPHLPRARALIDPEPTPIVPEEQLPVAGSLPEPPPGERAAELMRDFPALPDFGAPPLPRADAPSEVLTRASDDMMAEITAQQKALEEEAAELAREQEEEKRRRAEAEARREAEEKARRKAEEEAKREGEEKARREAEEKTRRKAEEDARHKAEEEARREAEEEAKREAEEEAKREAEEEAKREAEEKARRKAEEEARRKAEEDARRKAEEDARRKAEEDARRKAEEDARRKAKEEAKRRAEEEAKRRAEEEAKRRAEEEAKRRVEEEARRKAEEEAARQAAEVAALLAAEEEERQAELEAEIVRQAEAEARRKAEEEIQRRRAEQEERRQREAEAKRLAEEEARRKAEEEIRRRAEVEIKQLRDEEERKRLELQSQRHSEVARQREAEPPRAAAPTREPTEPAPSRASPPSSLAPLKPFDPAHGSFSTSHDIALVLYEIAVQQVTGRIDFVSESRKKSVFFERGGAVDAYSSQVFDRIEEYLYREGKITRAQYQEVRVKGLRSPRRVGAYLVTAGAMKPEELFSSVRGHLVDVLLGLFEWEEGDYAYVDERPEEDDRVILDADPRALIMEGIRRKYLMPRLLRLVGAPSSLLVPKGSTPLDPELFGLSAEERRVLRLLDGTRSVEDLVFSTGLEAVRVYQILAALLAMDAAEVRVRGIAGVGADGSSASDGIDRQRIAEKVEQVRQLDYFQILGVARLATAYEIDRAFERTRHEFAAEHFSEAVRRDLGDELAEIEQVLADARQVLRDDAVRDAYARHLP